MQPLLYVNQPEFTSNPRENLEFEAIFKREAMRINTYVMEINRQPESLIGKKPWEMTREIWESIIAPVSKAYKAGIRIGGEVAKVFHHRYKFTHNGYSFNFASESNSRHEVQVGYAFLRGDHVPDDVAAEYSKEYWQRVFMHDFQYLPRYVSSREEQLEAVNCWSMAKAHIKTAIDQRYFIYQSEADLKRLVACYDRILSELATLKFPEETGGGA